MRMEVLKELGHDMVPIDTTPYHWMYSRVVNAILWRLQWGPHFARLNRDLVAAIRARPTDVVWVDKGVRIKAKTLLQIKVENPRVLLVDYAGDSLIQTPSKHRSRAFLQSVPLYDILFTTKSYELSDYKRLGARNIRVVGTAQT
jgi:hypothetical protein